MKQNIAYFSKRAGHSKPCEAHEVKMEDLRATVEKVFPCRVLGMKSIFSEIA